MRYRYLGPGPHDDGQGGLIRPGEVRDYPAMPDWGPFELVEAPQRPAAPAAVPPPAPAPESPAAAGEAAQATASEPGEE